MSRLAMLAACVVLPCAGGCAVTGQPALPVVAVENPVLVPVSDPDFAWRQIVDVVDDYFIIDREDPVRQIGDVLTEGRIETFPVIGATLFEPWRDDSANGYERLESTLQSIRRLAVVRVIPASGGYLVDVAVFKELEDTVRPEHTSVGAATFRPETSMESVAAPVGARAVNQGWIPLGRDVALEQQILTQLRLRTAPLVPVGAGW